MPASPASPFLMKRFDIGRFGVKAKRVRKDVAGFSERWSSFKKNCYIFLENLLHLFPLKYRRSDSSPPNLDE